MTVDWGTAGAEAAAAGRAREAERCWLRGVEHYRELGERDGEAMLWSCLSMLALESGALGVARDRGERAVAIYEALGSTHLLANARGSLGGIAVLDGRLDDATALLRVARKPL